MSEDLYLEQLKLGPMENFIYILGSKSTREVTLIDPAWEIDLLFKHLEEKDLKLSSILVTHYHPDHIGGGMMGQSIPGIAELWLSNQLRFMSINTKLKVLRREEGFRILIFN